MQRRVVIRRHRVVATRIALLFLACVAHLSASQGAPETKIERRGAIFGAVTDSALRPVASAEVAIVLSKVRVLTDSGGRFRITALPPGNYLLTVRQLGFRPMAAGVTIQSGDTVRSAFLLESATIELPTVTTLETSASARLREFEERRQRGGGEFFDQKEIERRNVPSIVDVLRQSKSLRVAAIGAALVAVSARQTTHCTMQVFVDGLALAGAGPSPETPFDLNQLPSPKEIMAIEIYAGAATTPIWLPTGPPSGKVGCGAVLIWTRDASEGEF